MSAAFAAERRGSIVDEHERLIEHIDSIEFGLRAVPMDDQRIISALREVLGLARAHFEHEEAAMAESHYADMAAHKRDHDYLRTSFIHYIELVEHEKLRIPPDLAINLRSWLDMHIRKFDDPCFASMKQGE